MRARGQKMGLCLEWGWKNIMPLFRVSFRVLLSSDFSRLREMPKCSQATPLQVTGSWWTMNASLNKNSSLNPDLNFYRVLGGFPS